MFPVNKDVMGLLNPVMSEKDKYTSLLRSSDEFIGAVKSERVFSTADHIWSVKGEKRDKKKNGTPRIKQISR